MASSSNSKVFNSNKEGNGCRCEFVYDWLDKHSQYFPPQKPFVQPTLMVYAYETSGGVPYLYYGEDPMPARARLEYISKFIVPPPHRISPLNPSYHKKTK